MCEAKGWSHEAKILDGDGYWIEVHLTRASEGSETPE